VQVHGFGEIKTRTLRVSGLYHKALDDAMEDDAVVVPVARVRHEVLHRLRALLREELEVDVPYGGL
jgi:hypothetical protein